MVSRLFAAVCLLALSAERERDARSFESAVNVIIPESLDLWKSAAENLCHE